MEKEQVLGQEKAVNLVKDSLAKLQQGKGSVICISGEAGSGKSFLLKNLSEEADNVISVYVESQAPVGNFKIGNIQPLLPFTYLVEYLLEKNYLSAEKKLVMNAGLTMLAAIPFAGDVFYAVKELGRDWRQFKRDKSSASAKKVSTAAADYYDTIRSYADKAPLAVFFDDMHWADAQTVELLNLLTESIADTPLQIVLAYKDSILDTYANPLLSYIRKYEDGSNENVIVNELEPFTQKELIQCCKAYLHPYKQNKVFEDWLQERTSGVPGIISEYLKYFKKNNPFLPDGSLNENFADGDYLPATVQTVFSESLDKLSDEEKNLLAICSAEGRKFTALVVSYLLNSDVLTSIKKMRALQNKTGIIRSTGAHLRYGVKTTVYEFTRAYYHSFFENSLEYEEHIALHGQIAALLKQKYEDAASEAVRRQLAPYIAAHSAESGDEDTAKAMLLVAAKAAKQFGNTEVVKEAYESYLKITREKSPDDAITPENLEFQELVKSALANGNGNNKENGTGIANEDSTGIKYIDFNTLRRAVVDDYHNGKLQSAVDRAVSYLNIRQTELTVEEKAQILSLIIKIYVEMNDIPSAEKHALEALSIIEYKDTPEAECFVYNAVAQLKFDQNNKTDAEKYLKMAADKSALLPPELRLLTLSNIAMLLKEEAPEKAKKYFDAVRKLSASLRFDEFAADVFD